MCRSDRGRTRFGPVGGGRAVEMVVFTKLRQSDRATDKTRWCGLGLAIASTASVFCRWR
ncbi:hypothetical protein LZ30DRAFT_723175 [Colletotrichum cereale]|nr:hypothetical protein LZ30DRAFT_723175 [Colletotrichum cereale]